jgi:glycosyltransferase involved in cell wall biosynthesis
VHAVQPSDTVALVAPTGRAPAGTAPLRVAFCIDNMNVGGTELNALRTARHLVERGVELRVFTMATEGPLLQGYRDLDVPVHMLPLSRLYGRSALRQGRQLAGLVRQYGVQVVHAHDFYSNIFAGPWTRLAGAAFIASRRWWEGPERRLQRWANRGGYVLADRVLANSASVADLLERRERVARRHVFIVPNFLEEAAFTDPPEGWVDDLAVELGLPQQRTVIGILASMQPIKDHATLLRAAALLAPRWPDLYLVVAGADGGSRAMLEALTAELGLAGRVRFAGLRPTLPSVHHLFDVSALTSLSEGLPNSLLEAMAAGRPVVATAVGAVADIVRHERTGLLVRPRDAAGLAAALERMLLQPAARRSFGEEGRKYVREHHCAEAAITPLLAAYQAAARRGRSDG